MNGRHLAQDQNLHRASWALIVASALTAILYIVPVLHPLAYPFMLLSTLFHEMAHGFAAILVGGHFNSFKLWANGSGVANIHGDFGNISRAFVAAAGLLGPPIAAAVFFCCINSPKRSRIALGALGIGLALSVMLVVRNSFGLIFVGCVAALCFYFALGSGQRYAQVALAFIACQLALSVFSQSSYLFTDVAITRDGVMPSDVAQIADALFFPYWFWGALCGLISLLILAFGFKRIFR